jgi:hypothetical protein
MTLGCEVTVYRYLWYGLFLSNMLHMFTGKILFLPLRKVWVILSVLKQNMLLLVLPAFPRPSQALLPSGTVLPSSTYYFDTLRNLICAA